MKRILSALLVLMLVITMIPSVVVTSHAATTTNQQNIVNRANYLYNTTWVCKKTVTGWRGNYTFYAGNTYRLPYGQPVSAGAYIGYGVSVDAFRTAAANASSVFYSSKSNYAGKTSTYYATDCSAFVSWCWGTSRNTTYSIPNISTCIGTPTTSNVQKLKLGDCLNSSSHVVLVTGLSYTNGQISQIEITEQTPPQLKRSYYTPASLASKYSASYKIYRYNGTVPAAPSSSSSSSSSSNTTTSSSSSIKSVQAWLNATYNTGLTVDGVYGTLTKQALVKALQTQLNKQYGANLAVDGIYGTATNSAVRTLSSGSSGNLTKILQGLLICNGYSTNGFDGIYGNGTVSAVKAYQLKKGLTADGIAGKATFSALCK